MHDHRILGWRAFAALLVVLGSLAACSPVTSVDTSTARTNTPTLADIDFAALPAGFMWGLGSSSHQFEGNDTDSDWWLWEQAGHVKTGETSGLAADFWNRYEEDFDRLAAIGVDSFRLSISWARLYPQPGMTEPEPTAVAHYDAMLDALVRRHIRPIVTLHHFVLPNWITAQGRWETGAAIDDFVQLARFAGAHWGNRVDWWITVNEPEVFALHGWLNAVFPPGKANLSLALTVYANMMRAHAAAYRALKETDTVDADGDGVAAQVGLAQLIVPAEPLVPADPADQLYAEIVNRVLNLSWFDLNQTGVPETRLPSGQVLAAIPELRDTLDFIGINYYSRQFAHLDPVGAFVANHVGGEPRDMLYHEVYPQGLYDSLASLAQYGLPLFVTENGVADDTDVLRQQSLVAHVAALARFTHDRPDVAVLGYVHWALTDHFEWENGFRPRFGLYAIDYATQTRTVRPSAALYAQIIAASRSSGSGSQ
jgi:beta-glucosidase